MKYNIKVETEDNKINQLKISQKINKYRIEKYKNFIKKKEKLEQIEINQPNVNQSYIQIPPASEPIDIPMSD
jgi:hypothetical protein